MVIGIVGWIGIWIELDWIDEWIFGVINISIDEVRILFVSCIDLPQGIWFELDIGYWWIELDGLNWMDWYLDGLNWYLDGLI